MKSRILIVSFVTALISLTPLAQGEEKKHKIDIWLEMEMSRNSSTAGMRETLNTAREMWDKDMNETYKRLLAKLTPEQAKTLKESQRAWIAFRDADGKAISQLISSQDGTMFQLIGTDLGYQRVRERALHLRAYDSSIVK